jgi:hypothetical protein
LDTPTVPGQAENAKKTDNHPIVPGQAEKSVFKKTLSVRFRDFRVFRVRVFALACGLGGRKILETLI